MVGSSSTWKDNYWQSGFLIYADSCFNKGSCVLLLLAQNLDCSSLWLDLPPGDSQTHKTVDSVMENEAGGQRAGGDRSKKPQKKTEMKKLLQVVSSGCS